VKGIARATGGAAEFIMAGERIEEKVLRTFGRLTSPMASDVSIDWDGCDVQTLAELPPVFDGDVLAVFGRAPGKLPGTVTLSCNTAAGPKRWSVAAPAPADHQGTIATMWARRTIQSLEEVNDVRRSRSRKQDRSREQQLMVSLSKEFNLLSSLTTFIAVEHRSVEERNDGMPEQRRVPVQLAKGWGAVQTLDRGMPNVFGMIAGAACAAPAAAAPAPARRRSLAGRIMGAVGLSDADDATKKAKPAAKMKHEAAMKVMKDGTSARGSFRDSIRDMEGAAKMLEADKGGPTAPSEQPAQTDALQLLLSLQTADGWFAWTDHAAAVMESAGYDPAAWRREVEAALPPLESGASRERVVDTTLILLLLSIHLPEGEAIWRRAYQKACRHHLAKVMAQGVREVEAWLDGLRQKLSPAKQPAKS
jgi:hypothetical protein